MAEKSNTYGWDIICKLVINKYKHKIVTKLNNFQISTTFKKKMAAFL